MNASDMDAIRECFDTITRQNLALVAKMGQPNFDGFIALDPTLNKAVVFIHQMHEAVVLFPEGSFPLRLAWETVKTTLRLLKCCRLRYGRLRTKKMEQAFRRQFRLWFYNGAPRHPSNLYAKKIFDGEERLIAAICDHNASIVEHPPKQSSSSTRTALRGRKTPFMSGQLRTFTTFLLRHPILPSCKAATRARQCWLEHCNEWDTAAADGSGYTCYKTLARAYLEQ